RPQVAPTRGDNPLMSRVRNIAILLAVAIGAFYAGSLAEFQWGGYAPDWAKALLFYTPPKSNVDYGALTKSSPASSSTTSSPTRTARSSPRAPPPAWWGRSATSSPVT